MQHKRAVKHRNVQWKLTNVQYNTAWPVFSHNDFPKFFPEFSDISSNFPDPFKIFFLLCQRKSWNKRKGQKGGFFSFSRNFSKFSDFSRSFQIPCLFPKRQIEFTENMSRIIVNKKTWTLKYTSKYFLWLFSRACFN